MFDNTKDYRPFCRYYVSFKDGNGQEQETEIDQAVYIAFLLFGRSERNLRRSDERHEEYLELAEEKIQARAVNAPRSLEEIIFDADLHQRMRKAIETLPEIQKRRFKLYYESELTYQQIADIEKCTFQVVARSVTTAKEKLKILLK